MSNIPYKERIGLAPSNASDFELFRNYLSSNGRNCWYSKIEIFLFWTTCNQYERHRRQQVIGFTESTERIELAYSLDEGKSSPNEYYNPGAFVAL